MRVAFAELKLRLIDLLSYGRFMYTIFTALVHESIFFFNIEYY